VRGCRFIRVRAGSQCTGQLGDFGENGIVAASTFQLATRLGLRPYEELEKTLSVHLRRVPEKKRKRLTQKVYALAAEKLVNEGTARGVAYSARELRQRRASLRWTRSHVKNARAQLEAADSTFPKGLPDPLDIKGMLATLDDFARDLKERERFLANLVHPEHKIHTERKFGPPPFTPEFHNTSTRQLQIDRWFINAMDKCLPTPPQGKRSRFGRDKLIQAVFSFLGQPCSERRIGDIRVDPRSPGNKRRKP
jgi:hypothetical protein